MPCSKPDIQAGLQLGFPSFSLQSFIRAPHAKYIPPGTGFKSEGCNEAVCELCPVIIPGSAAGQKAKGLNSSSVCFLKSTRSVHIILVKKQDKGLP